MPLVSAAATFPGDTRYALSDTHLQTFGIGKRIKKKKDQGDRGRKGSRQGRESPVYFYPTVYDVRDAARTLLYAPYANVVTVMMLRALACAKKLKKKKKRHATRTSEKIAEFTPADNATRRFLALIDTFYS